MACIKTFLLTFTDVKHSRRLCDFRLSPHVNEVFTIMEYCLALTGNYVPTYRGSLLLPTARVRILEGGINRLSQNISN